MEPTALTGQKRNGILQVFKVNLLLIEWCDITNTSSSKEPLFIGNLPP